MRKDLDYRSCRVLRKQIRKFQEFAETGQHTFRIHVLVYFRKWLCILHDLNKERAPKSPPDIFVLSWKNRRNKVAFLIIKFATVIDECN